MICWLPGDSAAAAAAATNAANANSKDKWLFDEVAGTGGWSGITMGGQSDNYYHWSPTLITRWLYEMQLKLTKSSSLNFTALFSILGSSPYGASAGYPYYDFLLTCANHPYYPCLLLKFASALSLALLFISS